MNFPPYSFVHSSDGLVYAFRSISDQHTIQKYVIFSTLESPVYNLALVDLDKDGQLSDTVVSNNKDMERVFSTVIQIILHFLKKEPTAEILFSGSTPERIRLYRIIINKYIDDVTGSLSVYGIGVDQQREIFQKNRPYTSFVVSLI